MNYFSIDEEDTFSLPGCRHRVGVLFEFQGNGCPAAPSTAPIPTATPVLWVACYDEKTSAPGTVDGYPIAYKGRLWCADLEEGVNQVHAFASRDVWAERVYVWRDNKWMQEV